MLRVLQVVIVCVICVIINCRNQFDEHAQPGKFTCACGKSFKTKQSLEQHQKATGHGESVYIDDKEAEPSQSDKLDSDHRRNGDDIVQVSHKMRMRYISELEKKWIAVDKDERALAVSEYSSIVKNIIDHVRRSKNGKLYSADVRKAGSYKMHTKVRKPDEFDTNIVINIDVDKIQTDGDLAYIYEDKNNFDDNRSSPRHLSPDRQIKDIKSNPLPVPEGQAVVSVKETDVSGLSHLCYNGDLVPYKFLLDLHSKVNEAISDLHLHNVNLADTAHGPALTITIERKDSFDISVDLVLSLPWKQGYVSMYGWPRKTSRKVYDQKKVEMVKKAGVHLVPKGDETWFISFSRAEAELINNIDVGNECRRVVMRILKYYLDDCKDKSPGGLPGISSHLIKAYVREISTMQEYFTEVLSIYEKFRGCKDNDVPFWDVIVITAADNDQKIVYEKQLDYKHKRKELPDGVPVLVTADPPGPKLGNGGSTMTALQELYEKYGEDTLGYRILLIHAGGQSQRMPSASVLGKIFSPIPKGNPVYQMLDLKLAMFLPLIPKMGPGVFVTCADDFLVYNLDNECIQFGSTGFTALAHPSSISVGTGHGVYVIKDLDKVDPSLSLQTLECIEVLQKPSEAVMYAKGAVLKNLKFCDEVKVAESVVYTDSSFYFAHDITKKLLTFMRENGPLDCEIDAYGDFLQALGSRGTADYVNNVSNVSCVTPSLIQTRRKIYDILHESELTLLVMNSSKFIHIGTTKEYIEHFCCDKEFQSELGLGKDVFNLWIGRPQGQIASHGEGDCDDGPATKYRKLSDSDCDNSTITKYRQLSDTAQGCVMHSCLSAESSISSTAVVEFCNFSVPVKVGQNCILNNCEFDLETMKGKGHLSESAESICKVKTLEFPNNLFMHTIPVKYEGVTKYVTVFYDIKDNLKKVLANKEIKNLPFLGKQVEDYMSLFGIDATSVIPTNDVPTSKLNLWYLNMFPYTDNATESVYLALQCVHAIKTDKSKVISLASYKLVSMATILKEKDLDAMLENRDSLFNNIRIGRNLS